MASESVLCCPDPSFDAVVDYSTTAGCAKTFLERSGIVPTYRRPRPRMEPGALGIHDMELSPPLPLPPLQQHLNGEPPPDRAKTLEWLHDFSEET